VAASYEEACAIRERIEGKRMSRQAFGILPKIREVDEYLTGHPDIAVRVAEMHPEMSFAAWNGGVAMAHNKKKPAGKAERRGLIERVWPGQLARSRDSLRGEKYALDDLHDAFAVLWSVRRWAAGEAETLGDGVRDARGLQMRMVV
jgi:predicted RNase H-like nuclease